MYLATQGRSGVVKLVIPVPALEQDQYAHTLG